MKTIHKNRSSFDELSINRANKFNKIKTSDLITITSNNDEEYRSLLNDKIAIMIIQTVCKKYQLCYEDLKLDTKDEQIVVPRQICMSLIKDRTTFSLEKIGSFFNKDHATVLHAKRKSIPSWLLKPSFKVEYEKIETEVLSKEKFIVRAYKVAS
jgi:chromosomal replication initiation ATPase DnaA